jgi:hypothetical protein
MHRVVLRAVLAAAAACIAGSGGAAQAQIFPTQPVTLIGALSSYPSITIAAKTVGEGL